MELVQNLKEIASGAQTKPELISSLVRSVEQAGYKVVEVNAEKPWGGYIRIENDQADRFVEEFFPGVSTEEARLGGGVELSPKLLIVSPEQRLSWQYHYRRSEHWIFLSPGAYCRSMTDDQGEVVGADTGDSVQFQQGERHRLIGQSGTHTLVAEIWQHTDPNNPSDEDDIVRLQDDYKR